MNWCCICKSSGNSVDHLLIHCSVAREICSFVSLFSVVVMFFYWKGLHGRYNNILVWNATLLCLKWNIWRVRNNLTFNAFSSPCLIWKLCFLNHSMSGCIHEDFINELNYGCNLY